MLHLDHLDMGQGAFSLTADWQLAQGSRLAIIGPSGAGKSTLLSVIGGFLAPRAGRVIWDGQDITEAPPAARPITMLFQDQNLFPHLTIAQNIGLGLSPSLRLTTKDHRKIDEALDRTGLAGLGPRKPGNLSGGQQSRVALARALLRQRPILCLDEPFAALGPALKTEMLGLLAALADETAATVLMITHDPADARAFAPLTTLVAEGVAHPPTATAGLLDAPPPALAAYLG
jgi:thiamine transport system ATP-binding protein